MSNGLGFPIAFLAFVPSYVIGLQLLSAARSAGVVPSEEDARRLTRDGVRRSAVLLGASMAVFLFWPRDFERRAFLRGAFEPPTDGGGSLSIGFTDELRFSREGTVAESDEVALRITAPEGSLGDAPALWRGATLSTPAKGGWETGAPRAFGDTVAVDDAWEPRRRGLVRESRDAGAERTELRVTRFAQGSERLFAPLGSIELELDPEHGGTRLRTRADGTVDCADEGEITYELTVARATSRMGGGWSAEQLEDLEPWLGFADVADSEEVELARTLAERVLSDVPADALQHELVTKLGAHLSRAFPYVRPGEDDGARSLSAFLRGRAGGHCELFAAALATMLRTQSVPCRLVTGFLATPPHDGRGGELFVRAKDAHAWVEVLDPEAGWYAVDPTPRASTAERGLGWFARLKTSARAGWERVTGFDSERRAELYAWARTRASALAHRLFSEPGPLATTGLVLLAAAAALAQRRRSRVRPESRAYRSALRRAKLHLRPGETPRELLERARREGIEAERLAALDAETRRHERARYAT